MLDSEPVVELALDEFINILEQWRNIQNGGKSKITPPNHT